MRGYRTMSEAIRAWNVAWENGELRGADLFYIVLHGRRLGMTTAMSVFPSRAARYPPLNLLYFRATAKTMATCNRKRKVMVMKNADDAWKYLNASASKGNLRFI